MPNAMTLPLCLFLDEEGSFVSGFSGGTTPRRFLEALHAAGKTAGDPGRS